MGETRAKPDEALAALPAYLRAEAYAFTAITPLTHQQVLSNRGGVAATSLLLVTHGRMLRKNMRQELITEEELWAKLREQGVSSLSEAASAFMESSGEISVLKTPVARGGS